MNFWMTLLAIVAAVLVISGLCGLTVLLEKRFLSKRYDERQKQVQGKAAHWTFLTGFVYFFVIAMVDMIWPEVTIVSWYAVIFVGLAVEVLVYSVYCILNNANIPILGSPKQQIVIGYLCGFFQLAAAAARVASNDRYFTEDGKLMQRAFQDIPVDAIAFGQLMCGVLFVLVGTLELIRLLRQKEA